MFAPIYLAVYRRALVDAMYFLGTCAPASVQQRRLPPLLAVALRRLPEPATRKIAVQEPPSSAGHNDVPPAYLARSARVQIPVKER